MKRCIALVTHKMASRFLELLPADIFIEDSRPSFDHHCLEIRLAGDGLPDWCAEPVDGMPYARVAAFVENGRVCFGVDRGGVERIEE